MEAAEAYALLAAEALAGPQKRALCDLVQSAERRYAERREAAPALDFDDLLLRARQLLERPALRVALRAGLRALLVDEYQDVNPLQQELFEALAGPEAPGSSSLSLGEGGAGRGLASPAAEGGPAAPLLVAVGDLKQSIYRFRGADVAVLRGLVDRMGTARMGTARMGTARLEAARAGAAQVAAARPGGSPDADLEGDMLRAPVPRGDQGTPPGRVLHLSQNHRSSPGVLRLVNELFARCMQPAAAGGARPYELSFGEADRLLAVRTGGDEPACELLVDGSTEGDAGARRQREARAVAARVAAVVSGRAGVLVRERVRPAAGEAGPPGGEAGRLPRWGDVAILFRRLTQVGPYERALREAGIPCRLARGGGFYQAPEVRDLGELLASLTTGEEGALAALLRSPLCGVGEGSLLALARLGLQRLATWSPAEAARALVEAFPGAADRWPDPGIDSSDAGRLRRFLEVWGLLRSEVGRLAVADLLARAVERLDLEAAHLAAPDGERRLANLRKALALAAQHDEAGGDAEGFARRLRRLAAEAPREPEAELEPGDAVALMSVHQAKGLEWPVVFVPDLGAAAPADTRRAMRDPAGFLAAAFHDPVAGRDRPHGRAGGRPRGGEAGRGRRVAPAPLRGAHPGAGPPGPVRGGQSRGELADAGGGDAPGPSGAGAHGALRGRRHGSH